MQFKKVRKKEKIHFNYLIDHRNRTKKYLQSEITKLIFIKNRFNPFKIIFNHYKKKTIPFL